MEWPPQKTTSASQGCYRPRLQCRSLESLYNYGVSLSLQMTTAMTLTNDIQQVFSRSQEYQHFVDEIRYHSLFSKGGLGTENTYRRVLWLPLLGIQPFCTEHLTDWSMIHQLLQYIWEPSLNDTIKGTCHHEGSLKTKRQRFKTYLSPSHDNDHPFGQVIFDSIVATLFSTHVSSDDYPLGQQPLSNTELEQIQRDVSRSESLLQPPREPKMEAMMTILRLIFERHSTSRGFVYTQGFHEVIAMVLRVFELAGSTSTGNDLHFISSTQYEHLNQQQQQPRKGTNEEKKENTNDVNGINKDIKEHTHCDSGSSSTNLNPAAEKEMTPIEISLETPLQPLTDLTIGTPSSQEIGTLIKVLAVSERLGLSHLCDYLASPLELTLMSQLQWIGLLLRQVDHPLFSLMTVASQWNFVYMGQLRFRQRLTDPHLIKTTQSIQESLTSSCCPHKNSVISSSESSIEGLPLDIVSLSNCEFQFCLPWLLTWFTHDLLPTIPLTTMRRKNDQEDDGVARYRLCCRLWDSLLASPPLFPLCLCVALIRHPAIRTELFTLAEPYGIYPIKQSEATYRFPPTYFEFCDDTESLLDSETLFVGLWFHKTQCRPCEIEFFHADIVSWFQTFFKTYPISTLQVIVEEAILDACQILEATGSTIVSQLKTSFYHDSSTPSPVQNLMITSSIDGSLVLNQSTPQTSNSCMSDIPPQLSPVYLEDPIGHVQSDQCPKIFTSKDIGDDGHICIDCLMDVDQSTMLLPIFSSLRSPCQDWPWMTVGHPVTLSFSASTDTIHSFRPKIYRWPKENFETTLAILASRRATKRSYEAAAAACLVRKVYREQQKKTQVRSSLWATLIALSMIVITILLKRFGTKTLCWSDPFHAFYQSLCRGWTQFRKLWNVLIARPFLNNRNFQYTTELYEWFNLRNGVYAVMGTFTAIVLSWATHRWFRYND